MRGSPDAQRKMLRACSVVPTRRERVRLEGEGGEGEGTHWRNVPLLKISVMKLTTLVSLSTHDA